MRFSELCWLAAPDGGEEVTPGRMSLVSGHLAFDGEPQADWYPGEQDVARLVQIDRQGQDVQLLFVVTPDTVDLVKLRFGFDHVAASFVEQLLAADRGSVGDAFPSAWIQHHT